MLTQQDCLDIRDRISKRIVNFSKRDQIKALNDWKELIEGEIKVWKKQVSDTDFETLMQIKETIYRLKRNQTERKCAQSRRRRGLCYDCNQPAKENRTRCEKHLKIAKEKFARYYQRSKSA